MNEGVVHDGDITFTTAEDIWNSSKVFMKYKNFPNDVNWRKNLLDDGKLF
jgi:pyruvate kinase